MNADLVKANVFGKNQQKTLTAWYATRSSAAHAKYGDYTPEDVRLMILGIRDFVSRYPA